MPPQTRRGIGVLAYATYRRYAPRAITPPGLAWDTPGRHAHLESVI